MAEVLDFHRNSLPQNDENARKELVAYANLLAHYRQASSVLQAASQSMYGYRDLPMAPHNIAILSSRENHDLFAAVVRAERELVELLRQSIESDEKILALMAGG